MQSEIATTGFGPAVKISTCHGRLEFMAESGFRDFLTSKLVADDGKTAGQHNIEWLHAKLDAWIADHINAQ